MSDFLSCSPRARASTAPTGMRAKRIHVTAWVPGSEPEPDDGWADDGDEGVDDCHRPAARVSEEAEVPCW